MARLGYITVLLALCSSACEVPLPPASGDHGEVAVGVSLLTASERRVRAGQVRDAAAARGMTQGYLLAGIADAETNMSHCWSELTWACQGPVSPDCDDGPVVAGAGDGPCAERQGGLGMFQFDAGNYDDTLKREGDRILTIDGNVAAAVDFVVAMLIRSTDLDGIDDEAAAIAWSNGVRPDNERWAPWLRTVTRYYNGCAPDASCWTSRYALYEGRTRGVFDEMGEAFWEVPDAKPESMTPTSVDSGAPDASEPEGVNEREDAGSSTVREAGETSEHVAEGCSLGAPRRARGSSSSLLAAWTLLIVMGRVASSRLRRLRSRLQRRSRHGEARCHRRYSSRQSRCHRPARAADRWQRSSTEAGS